jgi:hypothetical protein
LKNAKDIAASKAISQNLMHKNLSITDGVYGILPTIDIREQITLLGKKVDDKNPDSLDELLKVTKLLIEKLESGSPK